MCVRLRACVCQSVYTCVCVCCKTAHTHTHFTALKSMLCKPWRSGAGGVAMATYLIMDI